MWPADRGQLITWYYERKSMFKVYNKYKRVCLKFTININIKLLVPVAALFYVIGLSENNNWRLHKCILKCLSLHLWGNIWRRKKQKSNSIYFLFCSLGKFWFCTFCLVHEQISVWLVKCVLWALSLLQIICICDICHQHTRCACGEQFQLCA